MGLLDKYVEAGLEEIACNLCGSKQSEVIARQDRFGTRLSTVICTRCGLIYLNPRWKKSSYAKFYEEDYRRMIGEKEEDPREMMLRQRVHGADVYQFCQPFLPDGAAVLDIGCGPGGILSAFQLAGDYALSGVEPSVEHGAYVREKLGLDVTTGMFGQVELPQASFDLVILTQTLNHMLDPAGTIDEVRSLLKPGGMFFVEVQNFPEFARRTRRSIQVDHVYYFCPETLECMARRIGLEPVRTSVDTAASAAAVPRYMWHCGASLHIRMLLRKSDPDPAAPLPSSRAIRRQLRKGLRHPLRRLLSLIAR